MGWHECLDCGAIFRDEDSTSRPSELEDGKNPWDRVMTCPVCDSDQLEDLYSCVRCGNPVGLNDDSEFCDECRYEIDRAFEAAFDMVQRDEDRLDLIHLMFQRAEERDFYG